MRRALLAAAMLATFAGPAVAQSATLPGGATSLTENHADWLVTCAARPQAGPVCSVSQQQSSQQSGQRVLVIELRPVGGGVTGAVSLPFGLDLESGIAIEVDDGARLPLRFKTCLSSGCLVELAFDGPGSRALQSGKVLNVTATASGGDEAKFAVSLAGFASALARATELTGP